MTTLQVEWVKRYTDLLAGLESQNLLATSHMALQSIRVVTIEEDEYVVPCLVSKENSSSMLWIVFDDEYRWLRFDSLGKVYTWLNQYYEIAKIDEYTLQGGKFKHVQTFRMNLRPMHSIGN